ncbi:MAG: hypothetical protein LN412_07150 [Candidatus Thermoplasmatota archaeon]|nr:hypothetical protein [Candidatus Thermoplasmatota archaeon]
MPLPKWYAVAKNEYRISTSRIRSIRPYFLYLVTGLLAVYVAFIAPSIVSLFIDDFIAFLLSQAAVAMMQLLLLLMFFWLLMIPITEILQQAQVAQLEIFLSAPVRPKDVLLGGFLGRMPIYAIAVTVVAGFFTAVLYPLGMDLAQIAIIIMIFILVLLSALWIGTVIAALLSTKLGKTSHGKDIGKALGVLIFLPMIALIYAIMGGGLIEALNDPATSGTYQVILGVVPSSWGAEIIVAFASSPGNIIAVGFETLTRFGGLVAFFLAALWLGTKAAARAYSLEPTISEAPKAKPDGALFKTIRYLGGAGSFGTLLVSMFKEYSRRLENLSWIAYAVGLFALVTIFLIGPEDPGSTLFTALFLLGFLAAAVASDVTLRGKENLFIYRKAPSGEGRFVRAMLAKGWLVAVPIAAAIIAIATALSPQATLASVLTSTGFVIQMTAAYVAFALGLFLLLPVPSENPKARNMTLMIVVMIMVFVSIGMFITSVEVIGGENALLMHAPLSWLLGIVFLYLGKRNLSRIE